MAFWGIEVKPGKPFPHKFDSSRGRLHISQATLGLGSATTKSMVQCNVGNKSPVFLCSLFPEKTESLQLHIEFEEAEEVIFSVIGPRSVHLTGHYLGAGRHVIPNDDSESYGEDIADTETERSDRSDEDYDDSFIDDDDPCVYPPSPVSDGEEIEETVNKKKPKNVKEKSRRLRKKYQLSESDDDNCTQQENIVNGNSYVVPVVDSEDEDWFPISSLCNPITNVKSSKLEAKDKVDKKAGETGSKKTEDDDNFVIDSIKETDDAVLDGEAKRRSSSRLSDFACNGLLPSTEVGHENGVISKKKRKERRKKRKSSEADSANCTNVLEEDQGPQDEAKDDKMHQNFPVRKEHQQATNIKEAELLQNTSLPYAEMNPQNVAKSEKKKKKRKKEDITFEVDSVYHSNAIKEDHVRRDEAEADLICQDLSLRNEQNQKQGSNGGADVPCNFSLLTSEVGSESSAKPKKKKKNQAKGLTTPEADSTHQSSIMKEDNSQHDETRADKMGRDLSVRNKQSQKHVTIASCDNNVEQLADENQSKKKKKKRLKTQENEEIVSTDNRNRSAMEIEDMNTDAKPSQDKNVSNGLIIEEVEVGQVNGKAAAPGKKISVRYNGKLKENGQVVDSNVDGPFKFRLGSSEVMEALNIGLDGMVTGGKRRLTIPPSMGCWSEKFGKHIPPDSWLVYDIELVKVH